jgi:ribulose-5-phosphate 4-epimerase/fuculose-1-phosphate aldolase
MTDTTIERQGGAGVWAPSVMPPIGVDLTDEARLACAFRILHREGFSENMAGHITWQRPGHEELLVNPWGLWWAEVKASDVCAVDVDANVVAGKWDVTPAIHIHTELHRVRPDARVVIHNHPYHVCVLAAAGLLPDLVHQQASLYLNDLRMVNEYTGEIDSADLGADLADRIGDANTIILANHGVIVTGATIEEAVFRAAGIDRACRMAFDVWKLQGLGHTQLQMQPGMMKGMKASLLERAAEVYWNGAVRMLIRDEPEVLD